MLMSDTMDIINLELILARNFSTDDTTRRHYMRSFNPTTVAQAQSAYPFIDWATYFKQVSTRANPTVKSIVNGPNFTFSVKEKDMITKLSQSLAANNAYGFTPRKLVNYLMFRLVANMDDFLPGTKQSLLRQKVYRSPIGEPRFIRDPEPNDPKLFENKDLSPTQVSCVAETMRYLQNANGRFFIDTLYPDKGVDIKKTAGAFVSSILSGFQSMIDQLSWMDATSKVSACGKINNLVQNIAFPDFIVNDTQLIAYFAALNITKTDDYVTMLNTLSDFNALTRWEYLARTSCSDRYDFLLPPGTVNAEYQGNVNSITFSAAILQPLFFHPKYPASLNYGGLGVVVGHEMTHGFDDQGVEWDGLGKLSPWMSDSSKQGPIS